MDKQRVKELAVDIVLLQRCLEPFEFTEFEYGEFIVDVYEELLRKEFDYHIKHFKNELLNVENECIIDRIKEVIERLEDLKNEN